jgi:hypothetical protein
MIDRIINNICFYIAPIDAVEMERLDIRPSVRADLAILVFGIALGVVFNSAIFGGV